jgi:hypothetical protein
MVQLSATRCSCIAVLWVSLVSFAAITFCVGSQRVFVVVYFVMTQSGNFWINPHTSWVISISYAFLPVTYLLDAFLLVCWNPQIVSFNAA